MLTRSTACLAANTAPEELNRPEDELSSKTCKVALSVETTSKDSMKKSNRSSNAERAFSGKVAITQDDNLCLTIARHFNGFCSGTDFISCAARGRILVVASSLITGRGKGFSRLDARLGSLIV